MCARTGVVRSLLEIWVFAQLLAISPACLSAQSGQKSQNAPQPEPGSAELQQPTAAPALSQPMPAPPPGASSEIITNAPALLIKDAFAQPESVLYDPGADVYLVSNLNGGPDDHDDNGFISRVSPEGKVLALKWIDGERLGIELHAPKGMAVVGDVLYVADIDHIRKFNVYSGNPLGAIAVTGAGALKDVSAAPDGSLFFTALGARAIGQRLEPTGQDAVYKLVREQPRAVLSGKPLSQPNGLWADASGVWVVTLGSNELYEVKSGTKANTQKLPLGVLDGLVRTNDGRIYVSSWAANRILKGALGGEFQVAYDVQSPADLGYDSKRDWLLIPCTLENAIKLQPL
jgi:hypothetical protein